jgi:hypothetical protein
MEMEVGVSSSEGGGDDLLAYPFHPEEVGVTVTRCEWGSAIIYLWIQCAFMTASCQCGPQ